MNIIKSILRQETKLKRGWIISLLLILTIFNLLLFYARKEGTPPVLKAPPKYHFYVVLQNSIDPFWAEVKRGASDAAKTLGVAIEFNAPRFNDSEAEKGYLEIAGLAKVDGIITHATNDPEFIGRINEADQQGIPVVTIETDAKDSRRKAFVGSNSFLVGEEAGKLIVQATKGKGKVTMIMSGESQTDTAAQNSMLNGFQTALKKAPEIQLAKIYTPKLGILDTEEIARSIINRGDINAVFSTDAIYTVGMAQTIVDLNKVGLLTIIGYGMSPEIGHYLQKGIVYAAVAGDPYAIGYESVKSLLEIKEEHNTSSFINTGIQVVDQNNLASYQTRKDKDGWVP